MQLRRKSIIALLVAALSLPALTYATQPAAAASANPVIADCLAHPGGLTGQYSVAQIRHALQVMSPETREYTSCPDVLNRALLAALGGTGTSTGVSSGGGSGSFLPTPVIIVLVVLILAAVTFGALAIRRRRQELAVGADGRQPRDRATGGGRGPDRPGDGDPSATQAPDEPDTPTERRPAGDLND
jgi:hypothetical protein